jgi:hypothetical protein
MISARPDVIKIDAEGAELRILRGARELLASKRPAIICEVVEGNNCGVASFFDDLGYVVYDGALPKGERKPLSRAPWVTVALPSNALMSHAY